ncbi:hypothetical protein GGP41_002960 [Bipolaris sorokiniana]|uniref:Uncharacterized protein n=1 Tax=Cochliobolus sativus TaxID=45130 RepID=A0A8H6DRI8_COCSA|nr:hypothetical protein GGP41_002960 [Bipolaris sorokiniana]
MNTIHYFALVAPYGPRSGYINRRPFNTNSKASHRPIHSRFWTSFLNTYRAPLHHPHSLRTNYIYTMVCNRHFVSGVSPEKRRWHVHRHTRPAPHPHRRPRLYPFAPRKGEQTRRANGVLNAKQ